MATISRQYMQLVLLCSWFQSSCFCLSVSWTNSCYLFNAPSISLIFKFPVWAIIYIIICPNRVEIPGLSHPCSLLLANCLWSFVLAHPMLHALTLSLWCLLSPPRQHLKRQNSKWAFQTNIYKTVSNYTIDYWQIYFTHYPGRVQLQGGRVQ